MRLSVLNDKNNRVSIHAPVKGATCALFTYTRVSIKFQSTPP